MKLVPILKQFIDATETAVFERLQKEEDVPGFKLVRGRGTRKWKADSIAKNMLYEAGISTCDLYTPGKFLSPAQAEKLIKKNKLTVDLGSLVETKFGAPKVVPITDNKPAINKTEEAKNDFSGCE